MVADAIGGRLSHAKDTYGCLIRHGSGMHIGVIGDLRAKVENKGLFSEKYNYIGEKVNGKYEYQQ